MPTKSPQKIKQKKSAELKAKKFPIASVMRILKNETKKLQTPIVTLYSQRDRDPFVVLISTMISLRTKDDVTANASERLFELADTPAKMLALNEKQIAKAIYPAGFYNTKAANILRVCKILIDSYESVVPSEIDLLVTFPGVGRKTANLVRTLGYNMLGICVDTHVHRITNRWGYLQTKTPDKTEVRLREILPQKYWIEINDMLVAYGQYICVPISPHCSKCKLHKHCMRVSVERSR